LTRQRTRSAAVDPLGGIAGSAGGDWRPQGAFLRHFSDSSCRGTGLGTCGFNPSVVEQMCAEAGFGTFRRVEMENPFNTLYEATA
jgi:hypothetical protein